MSNGRAKLLLLDEVAAYLAVTPRHVRNLMREGAITAIDVGVGDRRIWRFRPEEIEAFVERRRAPMVAAPKPVHTSKGGAATGLEVIDFVQKRRDEVAAKAAAKASKPAGVRKPGPRR